MAIINVHEAKSNLSKLLVRVEAGEEIIIARAGRPVARLSAVRTAQARTPGRLEGKLRVADDFDDALPEGWLEALKPGKIEG